MGRRIAMPLFALVAAAASALAAQGQGQQGSAIALSYSVQHAVIRPLEAVNLVACVTNQNVRSGRSVVAGDRFTFAFGAGSLGRCTAVQVVSPSAAFDVSDFTCDVADNELALTYVGEPTEWPLGDAACAVVTYEAPEQSATVLTGMGVANEGAFTRPSPAALLLSIAPDLGNVGPTGPAGPAGPVGPQGPVGPTGASGAGARAFAVSTGLAWAYLNEPPAPIPGLDVTLATAEGSALLIAFDGGGVWSIEAAANPPVGTGGGHGLEYVLEVDGALVARRRISDADFTFLHHITWQTGALPAGSHRVRVLVDGIESHPSELGHAGCVGSAFDGASQARLSVVELRAP